MSINQHHYSCETDDLPQSLQPCLEPGCGHAASDHYNGLLGAAGPSTGCLDCDRQVNPVSPTVREGLFEQALLRISHLYPEPPNAATMHEDWVGPNDGRMRTILLKAAINTAREALGMPPDKMLV